MDVHCHLDQYDEIQLKEILSDSRFRIIGAAINKSSGEKLLRMKLKYPKISVCLGIHPEYSGYYHEFEEVKKLIMENRNQITAIGEIGLPYFNLCKLNSNEVNTFKKEAEELFVRFLDLAKETELPVVLHAIEDTATLALQELKKREMKRVLFHWFEGKQELMDEITKERYYISVSPDILYNEKYAQFVSRLPVENMVVESDGPWEYNRNIGVPCMIIDIIRHLSQQKNMKESHLAKIIYDNSCRLFDIAD